MGRKTGLLSIESEQGPGKLWLGAGAPIHAETKLQNGFDAAVSVVNWRAGRFRSSRSATRRNARSRPP